MSISHFSRKRPKPMPASYAIFYRNQIVWVKVKGHQIWPGTISGMPGDIDGHRVKFKCNFYNNTDIAYVPSSGIFDFVSTFKTHAPKTISKTARDRGILEAFSDLDADALADERKELNIDMLLEEIIKLQKEDEADQSEEADSQSLQSEVSDESAEQNGGNKTNSNRSLLPKSKSGEIKPQTQGKHTEQEEERKEQLHTPSKPQQKHKRRFPVSNHRQVSQKQKKAISNVLPLADAQEEIGSDHLNSSGSEGDHTNTLGEKNTPSSSKIGKHTLTTPHDRLTSTPEATKLTSASIGRKNQTHQKVSPPGALDQGQMSSKSQLKGSSGMSLLGKRKQRACNDTDMICEERRPKKEMRKESADFMNKLPLVSNWAEVEKQRKLDEKEIHTQQINMKSDIGLAIPSTLHSPLAKQCQQRFGTSGGTSYRLNIYQFTEFLHLLLLNHQRTVRILAQQPEDQNPTRSFDTYLRHLKLVKRISEHIWDKPEPYTADMIIESKVRNGLWKFVSYCEAYYEDCYLVKRAHVNLCLIIQIFTNIVNNSVKARHKNSFKKQRMSMLPECLGQNNTTDSFFDRQSLISGTGNQVPSDIEQFSMIEPSEDGTLTLHPHEQSSSGVGVPDIKRELESCYKDLYNQIKTPWRQHSEPILTEDVPLRKGKTTNYECASAGTGVIDGGQDAPNDQSLLSCPPSVQSAHNM